MLSRLVVLSRQCYSIDIRTVVIKNIRNIHAVSTNQIANILHFSHKELYLSEQKVTLLYLFIITLLLNYIYYFEITFDIMLCMYIYWYA